MHKHKWQVRGLKRLKTNLSSARLARKVKGWNFPRCTCLFCSSSAAHCNCQWLPDGDQWGSEQSHQWLAYTQRRGEFWVDWNWRYWCDATFMGTSSGVWTNGGGQGILLQYLKYLKTETTGELCEGRCWVTLISFLCREGWQGWVEKIYPLLW